MKNIALGVFLCGALIGCQQGNTESKSKFKNAVPINNKFLTSEWKIESNETEGFNSSDYIYISPDNKFWRFSYNSKSYIIDSALTVVNENEIHENGNLKYSIYSLDSSKIAIVKDENVLFNASRSRDYLESEIQKFITLNPKKLNLNGSWEISSSEYAPTKFPSFCDGIDIGAKLVFHPEGKLEIFQKDSSNSCGKYHYKLWENELQFIEGDMVMSLKINELNSNSLVVTANFIRDDDNSEESLNLFKSGYKIELTKN